MQFLAIECRILMVQQLGHLVFSRQQRRGVGVVPYEHHPCKIRDTLSALLNFPACHQQTVH